LLFWQKPIITIDNPSNGTVMDKALVNIDVQYGKARLVRSNKKFLTVELLMDGVVVAQKTSVGILPTISGGVTFSVDLTNVPDGEHTLIAQGLAGFRGQMIKSEPISIEVKAGKPDPPRSTPVTPSLAPLDKRCHPETSFLYFTGHDEALSLLRGNVNITWSPAVTYSTELENFLWCGNFTYDVFVARGGFDFLAANISGPDLIALAKPTGSNIVRFETKGLQMSVTSLEPGITYSFLVTARTAAGHYSFNRNEASLNVSTTDPIVKSTFTRLVILPEPSDTFQVNCSKSQLTVTFAGTFPREVTELRDLDFVYFLDSVGNGTMAQLLSKSAPTPNGNVVWNYKPVDLTDVFDELDMNIDIVDARNTDDLTDDGDEMALEAEFEALDDMTKLNFCLMAYPGSASGICYANDVGGRKLFLRNFFRENGKVFQKAFNSAKKHANENVNVIATPSSELTLSGRATLLNIDRSAMLIDTGLEIGMKFEMSAKARFRIEISRRKLVHRANAILYGGYRLQSYLYFNGASSKLYKPPPLSLFAVSIRKIIFVGRIPVLITNRPSLSAFVDVATAVESKALVTASTGYDFVYELSYDRYRSDRYQKKTIVTRRPNAIPDPTFNMRLNVTAEVGVVFAWDFILYEILQATTAVDLGLRSELEVGTNVEAMVVSNPYFYVMQKFETEAFIRVRLMLGFNNLIRNIVRQIIFVGDNRINFAKSNSFRVPTIPPLTSSLPDSLQRALEQAKTHPVYGTATSITLQDLNSLVPDPYTGIKGIIQGLNRFFGVSFNIWSEDFLLLGTPQIALQAAPEGAQLCQGSNAIVLRVISQQTRALVPFLNGVQQNALWFANFDGRIFTEDTAWILGPDRNKVDSITLTLPRSAVSRPGFSSFEIQNEGSVYLRATPEIIPAPRYSMFAKASLKTLFPILKFECCDDSDCTRRLGPDAQCTTDKICRVGNRLRGFPSTISVDQSSVISLTVDLTNLNATGISEFYVYRVDSSTRVVGLEPIVSLLDVGSGAGNDTIAGDLIYSNVIAVQSTFVGESIGFQAVPVIGGVPNVNSPLTFLNLNATYSIPRSESRTNFTIAAGRIDELVLKITYKWPADKEDLDSGTLFLGRRVGFACGTSPYMNFTGDDTGLGGQESVDVFLGKAFKAGGWRNWTIVNVTAGWYGTRHRGPASVSLSTLQILSNGIVVNDNNLISFGIDPGVQNGCANKTVATANITVAESATTIDVKLIK
jgi:hypothetical protein